MGKRRDPTAFRYLATLHYRLGPERYLKMKKDLLPHIMQEVYFDSPAKTPNQTMCNVYTREPASGVDHRQAFEGDGRAGRRLTEKAARNIRAKVESEPGYLDRCVREYRAKVVKDAAATRAKAVSKVRDTVQEEVRPFFKEGKRYKSIRTIISRADNGAIRAATFTLHGNRCAVCGRTPQDFDPTFNDSIMHHHHIIPLNEYEARGMDETDVVGNLAIVCYGCHMTHVPETGRDNLNTLELARMSYEEARNRLSLEE